MNRRRWLGCCTTALAGTGGCLSNQSSAGDDDSQTDDPGDDDGTNGTDDGTGGEGSQIEAIVVRKAIAYESLMGSGGVLAETGTQYVVVSIPRDRWSSSATFTFVTDENTWESGLPETAGARNASVAGYEDYVAFTVPSPLSEANPRIRLASDEESEWSLPAQARDVLEAPEPEFELEKLSAPDTVSKGAQLSVSVTANNVSDVAGQFLAALYWPTKCIADDDESHVIDRKVPAGGTTTVDLDLDTRYTVDETESVTLRLQGHVSATREVEVQT